MIKYKNIRNLFIGLIALSVFILLPQGANASVCGITSYSDIPTYNLDSCCYDFNDFVYGQFCPVSTERPQEDGSVDIVCLSDSTIMGTMESQWTLGKKYNCTTGGTVNICTTGSWRTECASPTTCTEATCCKPNNCSALNRNTTGYNWCTGATSTCGLCLSGYVDGDDNETTRTDACIEPTFESYWSESVDNISNVNIGNVGIGTTDPLAKVHAIYDDNTYSMLSGIQTIGSINYHVGAYGVSNGTSSPTEVYVGVTGESFGGRGIMGSSTSGIGGYFTSESGYGLIVQSGNVGIGTATPGAKFHIKDTGSVYALIENDTGNQSAIQFVDSSDTGEWVVGIHGGSDNKFKIAQSTVLQTNTALTIDESLNVGIGTTSPIWKFHVEGTVGVIGDVLVQNNVDAMGNLQIDGSGSIDGNFKVGGNVGIGINSPVDELHIHATGGETYSPYIRMTNDNTGGTIGDGSRFGIGEYGNLNINNYEDNKDITITLSDGGNVGIGTDSPQAMLDVNLDAVYKPAAEIGRQVNATGDLAVAMGAYSDAIGAYSLATGYNTTASGSYSAAFNIGTAASGNYSIAAGYATEASGTHSAAIGGYASEAAGNYSATLGGYANDADGLYSVAMGYFTKATNDNSLAIGRYNATQLSDEIFTVGGGIGTTTRKTVFSIDEDGDTNVGGRLNVDDGATIEGDNGANSMMVFQNNSSDNGADILSMRGTDFESTAAGSYYIKFYDSDPSGTWGYNGGIRNQSETSVAYATSSDARLKTNIKDYTDGLETLMNIKAREFEWIEDGSESIGFIAQELQPLFPYAVVGLPNSDLREDYMMIDYGRVTPLLVSAIQEQQQIIENLTFRIEELEAKVQ